jgi:hypothetical protein
MQLLCKTNSSVTVSVTETTLMPLAGVTRPMSVSELLSMLIRPLVHSLRVNQMFGYVHLDISQSMNGPSVISAFICRLRNAFLRKVAQSAHYENTWWRFTTRLNFVPLVRQNCILNRMNSPVDRDRLHELFINDIVIDRWCVGDSSQLLECAVSGKSCDNVWCSTVCFLFRISHTSSEHSSSHSFQGEPRKHRTDVDHVQCLLLRSVWPLARQRCWLGWDWHGASGHEFSKRTDRRRWSVRTSDCFSSAIVIPMWRLLFLILWDLFSLV